MISTFTDFNLNLQPVQRREKAEKAAVPEAAKPTKSGSTSVIRKYLCVKIAWPPLVDHLLSPVRSAKPTKEERCQS